MKRRRYQYGSLTRKNNRLSEDVWQFRFYETTHEGCRYRGSTTIGTVAQYPTKTDALRIIEPLRLRLNLHHRFGRPISIGALIDHYLEPRPARRAVCSRWTSLRDQRGTAESRSHNREYAGGPLLERCC